MQVLAVELPCPDGRNREYRQFRVYQQSLPLQSDTYLINMTSPTTSANLCIRVRVGVVHDVHFDGDGT